jgi:antitoxin VapB
MGFNIEGEEAERLARRLSELTGEDLTVAVTNAIRERLERAQDEQALPLAERLLRIGRDCAPRIKEPFRSEDHGTILYDELGLPRTGD